MGKHGLTLTISIAIHKLLLILHLLVCFQDAELPELLRQDISGKRALDNIGAIQTVHAVGANNRCLCLFEALVGSVVIGVALLVQLVL